MKYQDFLDQYPVLNTLITTLLSNDLLSCKLDDWEVSKVEVFSSTFVHNAENLVAFRNALVQHNLIVSSKFYSRVYIKNLVRLFNVEESLVEKQLCELILSKQVAAKIDRPSGIVTMTVSKPEDELLDAWVGDVDNILDLIDTTAN